VRWLLSLLAIAGLIWLASAGRFSAQQLRSLLVNPVIWMLMVTWCVPLLRTERSNHYDWCCCHCRRHNVYRASSFSLPMFQAVSVAWLTMHWACVASAAQPAALRVGVVWSTCL
jgi:hypothetical protein